jgi:hypothetical protein
MASSTPERKKNRSKEVGQGFRAPAQVRTFAETLAGKRDPITEKDFSRAELKQIRAAIERSHKRGSKSQTVDYVDYGDDKRRQQHVIKDFSVFPEDAARNTLGRFKYEKTPEGRLVATDSYDFKDDLVDKNPSIPKSKDYESLSAFKKAAKLAKDSFNPKMGGIASLPSRIGSAYVGKTSRPVRLDLGEAGFKKGGKVKTSSASKRGDGVAKRGKTKGRMV